MPSHNLAQLLLRKPQLCGGLQAGIGHEPGIGWRRLKRPRREHGHSSFDADAQILVRFEQSLSSGVGAERHPLPLQFFPQGAVVLDDPVLHHRHPTGAIQVRVSVVFLRLAVRGPAGVAEAAGPPAAEALRPGSPRGRRCRTSVFSLLLVLVGERGQVHSRSSCSLSRME